MNRMTPSESESHTTPRESDESVEPVDISKIERDRLLFYLAGDVPVAIQELAKGTKQSAAELRDFFMRNYRTKLTSTQPASFVSRMGLGLQSFELRNRTLELGKKDSRKAGRQSIRTPLTALSITYRVQLKSSSRFGLGSRL